MTNEQNQNQAPQQPQCQAPMPGYPQQPPAYQAPAPAPQAYQDPAPTGGAKAGYFALGFFLMLIGVLISWLITKDKGEAVKSAGLKFSLIGFGVGFALWMLASIGLVACSAMILYA